MIMLLTHVLRGKTLAKWKEMFEVKWGLLQLLTLSLLKDAFFVIRQD